MVLEIRRGKLHELPRRLVMVSHADTRGAAIQSSTRAPSFCRDQGDDLLVKPGGADSVSTSCKSVFVFLFDQAFDVSVAVSCQIIFPRTSVLIRGRDFE
jgi:hypothetical protein